jgi:hypothetical protein
MPCILRAEVAFSQLDPADRIAIVMTNVTLEVTALLCEKNHLVTTDTSLIESRYSPKVTKSSIQAASVHLSTRRNWHD